MDESVILVHFTTVQIAFDFASCDFLLPCNFFLNRTINAITYTNEDPDAILTIFEQ